MTSEETKFDGIKIIFLSLFEREMFSLRKKLLFYKINIFLPIFMGYVQ